MNHHRRFSDKVKNYIEYRPDYPDKVYDAIKKYIDINSNWVIADVGSGTGKSSLLFLNKGHQVIGIEPNDEMRVAAEHLLSQYKFKSVNASAENTTLTDNSVDLIVAGQAFHWFDVDKCKQEFTRISKNGYAVLIWNSRSKKDGMMKAYEDFLQNSDTDYAEVNMFKNKDSDITRFFDTVVVETIVNTQEFDWNGFLGRALSSSYSPKPSDPKYDEFVDGLSNIFESYKNESDRIKFVYSTDVFIGKIRKPKLI
ncbi:MAG: class I SAM-dependent methyltransferase [Candidatus Heimdallarchaeota archaeon]|nr:class I SAM-dependent methyltransferase [Candidatus Heimdallarchaeota archaeon]